MAIWWEKVNPRMQQIVPKMWKCSPKQIHIFAGCVVLWRCYVCTYYWPYGQRGRSSGKVAIYERTHRFISSFLIFSPFSAQLLLVKAPIFCNIFHRWSEKSKKLTFARLSHGWVMLFSSCYSFFFSFSACHTTYCQFILLAGSMFYTLFAAQYFSLAQKRTSMIEGVGESDGLWGMCVVIVELNDLSSLVRWSTPNFNSCLYIHLKRERQFLLQISPNWHIVQLIGSDCGFGPFPKSVPDDLKMGQDWG